ncbi:hypothetical protein [Cohnella fermenti]|uniref:Uncharacterized protein n=1 Tax=Cohnella fermenti TaxID=2565925 RepID=A0A4S4C642_9BACL|nr:hypothetical protein [Cohnella fermenti]THF82723.1 hypothetical protein E6C55_06585 [Cohnella fermenti]
MSEKTVKQIQVQEEKIPVNAETVKAEPRQEEALVKPGRFGVTNRQLIPAIKEAIAAGDKERLFSLREGYLYTFHNSLRYLKKAERQFITDHLTK